MHHIIRLAFALLLASCLFGSVHSTCYVAKGAAPTNNCTQDFPCPTINKCINQIGVNDTALTVSLASGTYGPDNCAINLISLSVSISIEGNSSDPLGTVIDCGGTFSHFQLINATSISFSDIAFRNGYKQDQGGCIYAYNVASLVVKNSEFYGCSSTQGGAIFSKYSTLYVSNSTFTRNGGATTEAGGALYLQSAGNDTFTNCQIELNVASYGAGIYLVGDFLTFTDSSISSNVAYDDGAGLFLYSMDPTTIGVYNFQGTTISNNNATHGAGLYSQNLNHTWNFFGASFSSNNAAQSSLDSNIACNSTDSPFCAACLAADCTSDCVANDVRSCSLTQKGDALCYQQTDTCKSGDCKCKGKGLSTIAKMLLVMICVCLIVGTALILIGVVRFMLKRRANKNSYTPIK